MKTQIIYIPTKDLTEFEQPLIDSLDNFLLKTEAFVFTLEQLKQLLQDYTNKIVENTKTKISYDKTKGFGEYIDIVDKKSITNQLKPFLKSL